MHTDKNINNHVVIVGAGPVGLAAALFLVSKKIAVTVLEENRELSTDMRASTFHPPTLDMLKPYGVAEALVSEGHKAQKWQYLRRDTGDAAIFDLSVLDDLTDHPFRLQCEQFRMTRAVVEVLKDEPLFQIQFGTRVIDVLDKGDHVQVIAEMEGEKQQYAGAFAIGADGARSIVRQSLDFDFAGETYPKTSITVVVDFPFEKHVPDMLHVNYVWTKDDYYSLMRVKEYWRTGFSPHDDQTVEEALSDDNIQQHLNRILPMDKPFSVVHRAAYTIQRRVAPSFQEGRIILAGDSAHLNNPSGGMGMNSGIHDAHNAVQCIADIFAGADMDRFDLYSKQRRTIALEEVQKRADNSCKLLREKDSATREKVWKNFKKITSDRKAMREFLLGSSMIGSLQRASKIR